MKAVFKGKHSGPRVPDELHWGATGGMETSWGSILARK